MSIVKDVSEISMTKPYIVVETKVPWKAHHGNTVILGSTFNGFVFLKSMKNLYFLGDASGLTPPIMLKHLHKIKTEKNIEVHTSEVVSVVIRRLQNKKSDIPDVQPLRYEKLARSVIWSIAIRNNLMDKWISMEKKRIIELFEYYTADNIRLIYPMVKSKETAINDIETNYVGGKIIPMVLPSYEVFKWVNDILLDF